MLRMFEVTNTGIQWYVSVPIKEATAFVRHLIKWANTLRQPTVAYPTLLNPNNLTYWNF